MDTVDPTAGSGTWIQSRPEDRASARAKVWEAWQSRSVHRDAGGSCGPD